MTARSTGPSFTLSQVAEMTMLTERTLHNYLNRGLLHGQKTAQGWRFSPDEFSRFLNEPFVKAAVQSKQIAMAEDFLHRRSPTAGAVCAVYDIAAVTPALCGTVLALCNVYPSLRMAYDQTEHMARLTLCGDAGQIVSCLSQLQATL